MPVDVVEKNFKGKINVLFEVDNSGVFKVLYVDSAYESLKLEARRVFETLPIIDPPTYNGKPSYMQFTFSIHIPLAQPGDLVRPTTMAAKVQKPRDLLINEYDAIVNLPYDNDIYKSNVNIPLSHHNYSLFDPALNRVGLNNHTAQKPYTYEEVNKYYDFEGEHAKLMKNKRSWFGRKFWNEHMVRIKGKGYWMTLDPGVDLRSEEHTSELQS